MLPAGMTAVSGACLFWTISVGRTGQFADDRRHQYGDVLAVVEKRRNDHVHFICPFLNVVGNDIDAKCVALAGPRTIVDCKRQSWHDGLAFNHCCRVSKGPQYYTRPQGCDVYFQNGPP